MGQHGSTWVAYAFECVILLNCHLEEKNVGNWQMDRVLIILKKKMTPGLPLLRLFSIIFNLYSRS